MSGTPEVDAVAGVDEHDALPETAESAQIGIGVNQVELHYGMATDVGLVREVNDGRSRRR